ncbi:MAG: hypothetical protein A3G87_07525 [Omnitrophica bacterium RIFCSPLOWO2_12_FULL_50_11]|nr:MAG: hypothetical protein A3G87_07525 [Omnitrophica bacterium RIFCSPLOWO2_12_FULL_50_11]
MQRAFTRWIFGALGFVVLCGAIAFFTLPLKGQIPILAYHFVVPREQVGPTSLDVSQESFEHQMRFLQTFRFRPISLRELYEIKRGAKQPKGREIVITFDDGNRSYVEFALPILSRYGFPSANFLIWDNITQELHGSMDLEMVRRIAHDPLVTFGSHTLSHPVLSKVDPEQARQEIVQSRARFEQLLDKKIDFFAYPEGAFDDAAIKFVQEAGYLLAFTTSWKHLAGKNRETLYTLTRTKVTSSDNLLSFWMRVSGISSYVKRLRYAYGFWS